MLVGFSWERCFDAALGGLSTRGQGDGYEGQDLNHKGPALFSVLSRSDL